MGNVIKKEFGFTMKDVQSLTHNIFNLEFPSQVIFNDFICGKRKLFENLPIFVIEKTVLKQICGEKSLEAILNTFSINRNIEKLKNVYELELFCFYEADHILLFGNLDFAQTILQFEKFLISSDYIEIYKKDITKNNKEFTNAQKKLSQYFSLCVADQLYYLGYKLPMEKYQKKMIPRAEIDKIKIKGRQILSSCGDIDVLALNSEKKEVILIELKYYKPAINYSDMLKKDKSKVEEDEVMRKIKKREEVVSENIEEVIYYILGEYQSGYTVKSILLTPRTNYYAINEEKIYYLTWSEFIKKAYDNQL